MRGSLGKVDGFQSAKLTSKLCELTVVPDLGAKVIGLRSLHSGREWMWWPTEKPKLFRNQTGDAFPDSTRTGADECCPSIAPCRHRGMELTDHGEIWTEKWELDRDALAAGKIVTSVCFPLSPLRMVREVSFESEQVLNFCYTLENKGEGDFDFLWAFHPMMRIEAGDRLVIPKHQGVYQVDTAIGFEAERGDWVPREILGDPCSLSNLDLGGDDRALKCFSPSLGEGERFAEITNDVTGDYIRFDFEGSLLDTLGVWLNRGGWNGYHHVAIEPTNGAPDLLDLAVNEWDRYTKIQAGASCGWSMRITVGPDLNRKD